MILFIAGRAVRGSLHFSQSRALIDICIICEGKIFSVNIYSGKTSSNLFSNKSDFVTIPENSSFGEKLMMI
jgi:hypothetical protein